MNASTQSVLFSAIWLLKLSNRRRFDCSSTLFGATCALATTLGECETRRERREASHLSCCLTLYSAREALRACLPGPLRDATFSQLLKNDHVSELLLQWSICESAHLLPSPTRSPSDALLPCCSTCPTGWSPSHLFIIPFLVQTTTSFQCTTFYHRPHTSHTHESFNGTVFPSPHPL